MSPAHGHRKIQRRTSLTAFLALLFFGFLGPQPKAFSKEGAESRVLLKKLKQKSYEEVETVTDAELRAKSGSQSKWSLSGSLSYYGPSVDRLDSEIKPNPENTAMEVRTSVSGSVSARYRFSSSMSLSMYSGLSFYTPLSGAQDGEMNDPGLTLGHLHRFFGLQMSSRYSAALTTSNYYRNKGQLGRLNMSHDIKRKIGGSESQWLWSVGSSFNWYLFERAYNRDGKVSNYHLSVYPGLQYNIQDGFFVGSSLAFAYSNLREEPNWWNWDRRLWSQRLTFGYAFTRDVFFSPYLNFYPEQFEWKTTSANLNLYLNLF
ncbi:MAG TPA: hypothetical protein DCL41_00225 [Bdellovibrionales bacterium]|nr:hypothetical protein [Pseudobdellovibrionaceae bacterium]HAG90263.1 hypothetical protein [Bdellovibrionales bacterium]